MIFFFSGRLRALFMYQISLIAVSMASEPELVKNTFDIGTGAMASSRSARAIWGSWLFWPKP